MIFGEPALEEASPQELRCEALENGVVGQTEARYGGGRMGGDILVHGLALEDAVDLRLSVRHVERTGIAPSLKIQQVERASHAMVDVVIDHQNGSCPQLVFHAD